VKHWFDSLFARMLLVQGALAVMVLVLVVVFGLRMQFLSQARATAPLWAAALAPVLAGQTGLPSEPSVQVKVRLLAGPPPADAAQFPFIQRSMALAAELRAAGVPVQAVKISGRSGDAVTWLQVQRGDQLQWIGVQNQLEGADLRLRGLVALLIGTLATLGAAWWLSQRVLRPVADLRQAMRHFATDGQLPAPAAASAPAELRELSQQFAELARQRLDLDTQRRTMLAAISHDLRSPLGRIRLAAELLPDAEGVAVRREAIVRNVGLADRLLGSFIDLARADDAPIAGRVELGALVDDLMGGLVDDPARGAPDLAPPVLPAQPLWLQPASAVALERALRNLIDNARHHGAPPIELALRRDGPWAVLTVRDHGAGIAPAARATMLQPFTRGDASRHKPGTGLGLAIVQRTAVRHGGQLLLDDAAPGLRAELRLPLAPG
jgi:two-component system, OmpR family, osmolarity sensor histidine kinase EnvZ